MQGAEFERFRAALQSDGRLLEEIVLLDGMILDGRNRQRECDETGIAPRYRELDGEDGDPLRFVIAKNLSRRHLDEGQQAMVAAKLANMRQGERTDLSPIGETLISQSAAAGPLNVGKRSVERAADVIERGAPELSAADDAR
jgi:hypothetical protein